MTISSLTKIQKQWLEHRDKQKDSGLSRRAYCSVNGLNEKTMNSQLAYIRKKLSRKQDSGSFINLTDIGGTENQMVLSLGDGITITCPVDVSLIKELAALKH